MIKVTTSACINANKEETWKVLSQVENIYMWSESIQKSYCTGDIIRGVGTERTCILKGNIRINEKWVEWDEGNAFTYIAYNMPLVKSARNTWSLISEKDKTLIISKAEITMKGGLFGRVLEPVMSFMTKRIGSDAMAAFKYLVEEGKPYKGMHSKLTRAAIRC